MHNDWEEDTQPLESILDILRFALTKAHDANLYYGHGTDNAWDDMRSLILGSLHLPEDVDPLLLQAKLTISEKKFLLEQLEKRIVEHVPVPYLTNKAYFCGFSFYIDDRALIPRSPIAELINQQFAPWVQEEEVHSILDMCTGSGCIAIACSLAFPDSMVYAADISEDALAVANINCANYGLEDYVTLIESDGFNNIPPMQFDLIVSNPPYVGLSEMQTLPNEYLHEPNLALEAQDNGLAFVERLLRGAIDYLSPEGVLIVEVGNSEEALVERHPDLPFTWLEFENGGHGVFVLTRQQLSDYFERIEGDEHA